MLDFFRRYQRYFFFVISIVIIISFSFFGTYSTLGSNTWREQLAFQAVDGREVSRSDVDEMALFLGTDNEDKQLYGGVWGPNFLNDGVIRKEFLQTGLAQELVRAYQDEMREPLNKRLEKEKKFVLYTHPHARFLSAENAWGYFAPEMMTHLNVLQTAKEGTDAEAFDSRVKVFLAEKKFPSSMLKQVLRYQERQYSWLTPDPDLDRLDLSLFGYHTIEDWFTPHFTRLVSEFIINASILAEAQGYEVSKAEVMADLIRNTQLSYRQNQNNPLLGVASPEEYFNEQLRLLNMDQARAIKIWRQVLLFRRYFEEAGHSALVDPLAYQTFNDFSHETVTVDLYRLPASLRLANYDALQKFEIYLAAVGKDTRKDPLALPQEFLSVAEVERVHPELVQKRYLLEVAQVNQRHLQARIGLKELWNWEVDDQNWASLKAQFPELGLKSGKTREERFEALDSLESIVRSKVDAFASTAIVRSHPEWIDQALSAAQPQSMVVGLRAMGGTTPFSGLDKKEQRQELIRLLDQAALDVAPAPHSLLQAYTADNQVYYRIRVIERADQPEILTFAEAASDGTLDDVRTRVLEKYYVAIREQNPALYQRENKEWKAFKNVREAIADHYLNKVLAALQAVQKALLTQEKEPDTWSKDQAASLRFYHYLQQVKAKLEKDPSQAETLAHKPITKEAYTLGDRLPLKEQWLLEQTTVSLSRQDRLDAVNTHDAFELPVTGWSSLHAPVNGDLAFFQVTERGEDAAKKDIAMAEQVKQAQALLSADAQRVLMQHVLEKIKEKNAISLHYLQTPEEPSAN